jgi:hypothetical protein
MGKGGIRGAQEGPATAACCSTDATSYPTLPGRQGLCGRTHQDISWVPVGQWSDRLLESYNCALWDVRYFCTYIAVVLGFHRRTQTSLSVLGRDTTYHVRVVKKLLCSHFHFHFVPWRWRQYIPPQCSWISSRLCTITSQKKIVK